MRAAGYNRRHRMRTSQRLTAQLSLFLLLLFAATPLCRAADDWSAPAADLARQIAALTGPGGIALSIANHSSIASDQVPAIRRTLLNELGKLDINDKPAADAATIVRVTLSQTARQGLWVAEVQQGTEVRVAMVAVANAAPPTTQQGTAMLLRKTLLFSQPEPILDAALIPLPGDASPASHLVVLSAEQIATYHRDKAAWVKDRSFEIAHSRPYPRDIRGRLQTDASALFKAYLPGVICMASQPANGTAITVSCADSDDPWPLGVRKAFYNSSRDYFTGVTIPSQGGETEPFYSSAELLQQRGAVAVYSEVGGQFRVSDGSGLKPLAGTRDWGSDIAGVQSACGSGAQVLAASSGDAAQDSLLAYEIQGHDAVAVSAPLPLNGQVAAIWPMTSATTPAAMMILEKQQPFAYEAYSVSVVCNQ